MKECKVFIPFGAVGTGIDREAFERGLAMGPDILSSDAGSTDSGPFYLGTGNCKYARDALKNDLRMLLTAAHSLGIPITIGSAGTCGTDNQVDAFAGLCDEICREEGFSAKIARIYTQQDPARLREKYRAGKLHPLTGAPEITEETFEACSNIVALAGAEPFMEALKNGADIVICGRATDTAVIAALPLLRGCDRAMAWHGAKTTECGGQCTVDPTAFGGVFATFDAESFTVEATAQGNRCSTYSVSAHLLYENADPIRLTEPGCVIDTSEAVYEELEGGAVRAHGSRYEAKPYTMKLEGSAPAGYQTIALVGVRDRDVMRDPQRWMDGLRSFVQGKLDQFGISREEYSVSLRAYGYNAVYGGPVPQGYVPNELGVLLTVTASSQALANRVAKAFNPYLLHFPVHRDQQLPSFAFPFSPAETERGAIYRFMLNHVVEVEDPMELVRIEYGWCGRKEGE